jgi:hypothetical protein
LLIVVCWGNTGRGLLRASPELKTTLLCLSSLRLIQPSWLLCSPNKPRPLDYLTNRFKPVRGQLFHWFPLPSTSCAEDQLEPTIAPS